MARITNQRVKDRRQSSDAATSACV